MAKQYVTYLQTLKNNYGDTWYAQVTPEMIQKNIKRIVKEIGKGSYDYQSCGQDFLQPIFLENLIIGISNELEINTLDYMACGYYYNCFPMTPNMGIRVLYHERVNFIYNTILERLNYVKASGNIGYMADVAGLISSDKKYLDNI